MEIEKLINFDRKYKNAIMGPREYLLYNEGKPLLYDDVFHKLSRGIEGDIKYNITIQDFKKNKLYSACNPAADIGVYERIAQEQGNLKPKIHYFRPIGKNSLFAAVQYYTMLGKGDISQRFPTVAIAAYSDDNLVNLTPINIDYKSSGHTSGGDFLPLGEQTDSIILCFYPIQVSKEPDTNNRFLAVFERRGACYQFKRFLDAQLTATYRLYFGNNLYEMFAQDDRYVALFASDEIVDYLENKTYHLPLDSLVPLGQPSLTKVMTEGISGVPVLNNRLSHQGDRVFLHTRLNGKNYMIAYDTRKKKIQYCYELKNLFPGGDSVRTSIDMVLQRQSIFMSNPDERVRVFPYELLWSVL